MSNEDTDTTTVELLAETAQRLQNREQPGDEGCDDVVRRLRDATVTVLSMEEAAQRIRDAYDDLFAVMIDSSSFHREDGARMLLITVHVSGSDYESSPSLFDDVQRIAPGGEERPFRFFLSSDPPKSGLEVPVYWEDVPTVGARVG